MKSYELKLGSDKAEAVLFCYDFSAENYAGYLSLLLSFLVFFIVMIAGVRRKIRYLITMRKELCMLSENLARNASGK